MAFPEGQDQINSVGITAIACCSATLELNATDISALQHLQASLPLYDALHVGLDKAAGRSKLQIFADIPVSDHQCELAWTLLAAFETENGSHRPSAQLSINAWRNLLSLAVLESLSLTAPLDVDRVLDLLLSHQAEEIPRQMYKAVLHRLEDQSGSSEGCKSRPLHRWVTL